MKIGSFLDAAELVLFLAGRPRSRYGYFILAWLGNEEAEKVRNSRIHLLVADYDQFREALVTLFGKFEFEGAYRAKLKAHRQSGAETAAEFAARTTDICARAYSKFTTEA